MKKTYIAVQVAPKREAGVPFGKILIYPNQPPARIPNTEKNRDLVEHYLARGAIVVLKAETIESEVSISKTDSPETETATELKVEDEPKRCQATTASGKQCKRPALPGSDFCMIPAHQAQGK